MAIFQFKKAMGSIQEYSDRKVGVSISFIGAIGVMLAGVFTILNIFFGFGGF